MKESYSKILKAWAIILLGTCQRLQAALLSAMDTSNTVGSAETHGPSDREA